jgi:hypothetical protein
VKKPNLFGFVYPVMRLLEFRLSCCLLKRREDRNRGRRDFDEIEQSIRVDAASRRGFGLRRLLDARRCSLLAGISSAKC